MNESVLFTHDMASLLKRNHREVEIAIVEPLYLQIKYKGNTFKLSLQKAYREVARKPEEREKWLNVFAKMFADSLNRAKAEEPKLTERPPAPPTPGVTTPVQPDVDTDSSDSLLRRTVLPAVRPAEWLQQFRENNTGLDESKLPAAVPINKELVVFMAAEDAGNILTLSHEQLRQDGLTTERCFALAVRNFEALVPEFRIKRSGGFYSVNIGRDQESSLLLLNHFWDEHYVPVNGRYVVGIPTVDTILITGDRDEAGMETLKGKIKDINLRAEQSKLLTHLMFVRNMDHWAVHNAW